MHHQPDVCISGAGIIGLALALELNHLGATVCVLERDTALSHASQAAAGMLAAYDPENPPRLLPLSELSLALYPAFLDRIAALSGEAVPFQTALTFQSVQPVHAAAPRSSIPAALSAGSHTFTPLAEQSIDPRQLAPALLAAVRNTPIQLVEHTAVPVAARSSNGLSLETTAGAIAPGQMVYTLGAWSFPPVTPRKGQMFSVKLPPAPILDFVVRTPDIYIVPRIHGPYAGRAIIGATVEDVGFSLETDRASLAHLRALAAGLIPALADESRCPQLEAWAGLRPHTPDRLPILGALPEDSRQFLATGHYRNGILLAPATAHVMAQILQGRPSSLPLEAFSPHRFHARTDDFHVHTGHQDTPIFAHPQ